MPRVKPGDRIRAKRPKTKTGCLTCRLRRIKCDEEKPSCFRCSSTGRKCDWHPESLAIARVDLDYVQMNPFSSLFESSKEHRAFAYFQERTSAQLSGFFTCEFWECIILQGAHDNTGIRHAILALASLHEDFEGIGEIERSADDFALKQYNSAIRQHLCDLKGGDVKNNAAYLASCIVFISIELLQCHYSSALSLIKGALRLLSGIDVESAALSPWPLETFELILCRLQIQALYLGAALDIGGIVPMRIRTLASTRMPKKFTSLVQAKEHLEIFYYTYRLAQAFDIEMSHSLGEGDMENLLQSFQQWSSAFEELVTDLGDNISDRDKQSIDFLRMVKLVLGNAVVLSLVDFDVSDAMIFDSCEATYEKIIDLAEAIISRRETVEKAGSKASRTFTLDVDVIGTLADTVCMCRDPTLRRRAIHLLRTRACREGLYDNLLAARAVERLMEMEEESAGGEVKTASDIPAWARFTRMLPSIQPGDSRIVTVDYCGQREPGESGVVVSRREVITW